MKRRIIIRLFLCLFSLAFIGHLISRALSILDGAYFGEPTQWAGHGDISVWGLNLS
jgi:hypothetical protein